MMARTVLPVRRLNAVDLGIDTNPQNDTRSEALSNGIPNQVDAPILTEIDDYRLIRRPGRPIGKSAPIAGLSQYLEEQYDAVASDLAAANTDPRTVAFFREAKVLLRDWSIAKLLSFGAHLYLLENSVGALKRELSDPLAQRVDAVVRNSRMFINSFEEWHAYVRQSVVLDVTMGDRTTEIVSTTTEAAVTLAIEQGSVDSEITRALTEFAEAASRKDSELGAAVGIMSALRSFTNVSISFVGYIANRTKAGFSAVVKDDRPMKLLRTICRFFPLATRLTVIYPDLSWVLNHADEIRALCESLEEKS
jgi:hypothetical protein